MADKFTPDQKSIVSFSLMGPESGAPCQVDYTDGRITRHRAHLYDNEETHQ